MASPCAQANAKDEKSPMNSYGLSSEEPQHPKSTTDEDGIDRLAPARRPHHRWPIRDLLLPTGSAGEQSLSHLDVTRHSDTLITLKRFIE